MSKKHLTETLDRLQDISHIEEYYPELKVASVRTAAADLQRVMDGMGEVDGKVEYHKAMKFKNRAVESCTLLHFAIWFVTENNGDADLIKDLLDGLADPDEALRPAWYRARGSNFIFVRAVHIAANFGQLPILKLLLQHATTSVTTFHGNMSQEDFVSDWARELPEGTTAEDFLAIRGQHPSCYYQPIHDSTYAANGEVTLWLLKSQADPLARNQQQITPLHFVAFCGIKGGLCSETGQDLARIVKSLQRTGQAVSAKANMSSFIKHMDDATPLEVAVADSSRYPQDQLGLLAPCLAHSNQSDMCYFDDLRRIAEVTPDGAVNLVRSIREKGTDDHTVLQRFRINAQREGMSDVLASILYLSPTAASEMMDLLEVEPAAEDPARCPIPTKTSVWGLFQNIEMRCVYETDVQKKQGLTVPCWLWHGRKRHEGFSSPRRELQQQLDVTREYWHDSFAPKQKSKARNASIKRVRVVASLMPGLLDIDIFMAMSQCAKHQPENIGIMSRKTIRGAILCLWTNLVEQVWALRSLFAFLDTAAYVTVSGLIQQDMHYGSLCFPIIAAGNFQMILTCLIHNVSVLKKWFDSKGDATMADMWSPTSPWNLQYSVPLFLQATLGSIFVIDMYIRGTDDVMHRTHFDDVLLATCLLLSCFRFIKTWAYSVLGSRLYSIEETFLAGAVNQFLFITFLLLFSFIAAIMVLSRLHTVRLALDVYRGFLFGDGEGFNGVGMDENAKTHLNTGGSIRGNHALIGFAVFGSFFFNVIVLNIMIAIYSTEYDRVQNDTPWLFMLGRADYCVKQVLSTYVIPWRGEILNRCLIALALVAMASGVVVAKLGESVFMSASLIAMGQVLLPMAMMQCPWFSPEGQDAEDNKRYLWMCHPQNWQAKTEEERRKEEDEAKQEEVEDKFDEVDDRIFSIDAKMEHALASLRGLSTTPPQTRTPPRTSTPQSRQGSKSLV